jgi:hypothetical protein
MQLPIPKIIQKQQYNLGACRQIARGGTGLVGTRYFQASLLLAYKRAQTMPPSHCAAPPPALFEIFQSFKRTWLLHRSSYVFSPSRV